mmetsp:Transcript_55171/g.159771  ORF Transcript_55171/g.159771 Transcript_55171/m.159771 type:complete len:836 (+) Transcript_55171:129-2636(+)
MRLGGAAPRGHLKPVSVAHDLHDPPPEQPITVATPARSFTLGSAAPSAPRAPSRERAQRGGRVWDQASNGSDSEDSQDDVFFRLQVERKALQRSCVEWIDRLEALQRDQLGALNMPTSPLHTLSRPTSRQHFRAAAERLLRLRPGSGAAPGLQQQSSLWEESEAPPQQQPPQQPRLQALARFPSTLWCPKPEVVQPEVPQQPQQVLLRASTATAAADHRGFEVSESRVTELRADDLEVSDYDDRSRSPSRAPSPAPPEADRPMSRGTAWEATSTMPVSGQVAVAIAGAGSRPTTQQQQHQRPPSRPLKRQESRRSKRGSKTSATSTIRRQRTFMPFANNDLKRSDTRQFAARMKLTAVDERPLWRRLLDKLRLNDDFKERTKALADDFMRAREAARDRRFYKLVHCRTFQSATSLLILLNALYIGVSTEVILHAEKGGTPANEFIDQVEFFFAVVFSLELMLRFLAERVMFFVGFDWKWNLMDSLLVGSSIFDIVLNSMGSSDSAASNITTARILRLARFARLFRLVHTVRAFHSFRIVILGIIQSMSSLYWCFFVIGFIIYMFAVFFLNGVSEHYRTTGGLTEDTLSQELNTHYGSMKAAMVTLFMTISGGIDWTDAMRPLVQLSWMYEPVFLFYIFFMFFAVLNVVVGTFVATTSEISSKDRDMMVKAELIKWEGYAKKIKEFFKEADTDKSGMLSWEEFEAHLQNSKVRAYFQALELDVTQAYALFRILDVDNTGEVTPDEFVDGCMRLKNQAKSLDIKLLMYQNEMVFAKLNRFMEFAMRRFISIDEKITAVARRASFRPIATDRSLTEDEMDDDPEDDGLSNIDAEEDEV